METLLDYIVFDEDFEWRSFHDEKDELLALIEQKADFSVKNNDGQTVLFYIAQIGADKESEDDLLKILKYALECGCKFSDQDNDGRTAIHHEACQWQDILHKYAIETGNTDVFDIQDNYGNTPLHIYCTTCHSNEWARAVKHGADPYVKNKDGLMPHELIATANNPASAKKQFMKTVEKILGERPQQAEPNDEYMINPAWKTPAKANDKLSILGIQRFETDANIYRSFFGVNERFAVLNTDNFRQIVDLQDGSVKYRVKRNPYNSNEKNCSYNGVWYTVEDNSANEYLIAIDPEKGIDPNSGISLWQTIIGSIQMYIRTEPVTDGNKVAINTSSALIVLDAHTGKVLWRAKPKGRVEDTAPVIHDSLIYTQCLVRKKPVLLAFDALTGTAIEEMNIELAHPMFQSGWRDYPRHELVHNGRLHYLTQDEQRDIRLVVVDLTTGKELFSQIVVPESRFELCDSRYGMVAEGDRVHIFINDPDWAATLKTDVWELAVDADYEFFNKYYYNTVRITSDKLYVTYNGDDYASVEIYSRADSTLLQRVELPPCPECIRPDITTVVCDSGVIYTFRFAGDTGAKNGELCMIG